MSTADPGGGLMKDPSSMAGRLAAGALACVISLSMLATSSEAEQQVVPAPACMPTCRALEHSICMTCTTRAT